VMILSPGIENICALFGQVQGLSMQDSGRDIMIRDPNVEGWKLRAIRMQ
jgi:hypothetical protein